MTTDTEMESVSRETSALILAPPEGERTTPTEVDVLADDRAEARSWSPNTRSLAGNPDSPQAVVFLTSIID